MPPKSAVAAERLKKELTAQQARAEALKHLQSTGSGPSQRELAQQQQLRQRQTTNATSATAQRRVIGSQPTATAADKFDPRIRDNTLHAVALRRAQELQKTQQIEQMTESYHIDSRSTEKLALPLGWQEAVDPASGDVYYWNENTQETVWERPGASKQVVEKADDKTPPEGQLEDGWEEVPEAASGDVYYWNRKTNETTWTRPAARSVSLAQALEAKAKLDEILKGCGNTSTKTSANVRPDAKTSIVQSSSLQRSYPAASAAASSGHKKRPQSSSDSANKKHKRSGPSDGAIDPMDPTGSGGKWSDGLVEQGDQTSSALDTHSAVVIIAHNVKDDGKQFQTTDIWWETWK
ncbi:hypothetical protein BBJ29_002547 [Phytophthora kernoviae]|uniref:WW domain-containing protein n=1 Tax=Phytophthora kernoviae TaxID=325452 RepID=A0A3F2S0F7_9STRA|nr:hypothetical protein BBJ29_002547 [Phytophthora kernoviae]RLN66999.1 hypothetical protein BBP00_00001900 [Phytophthora kernoviae]